jgi:hypothetical protein
MGGRRGGSVGEGGMWGGGGGGSEITAERNQEVYRTVISVIIINRDGYS